MTFRLIIFLLFIFPNFAFAGDVRSKGYTLEEDSYVFTVDEAKRLLARVEELEKKELLLSEYTSLNSVLNKKISLYESNYSILNSQINQYENLISINEEYVKNNRSYIVNSELKHIGIFILGALVTTGSFLVADHISDTMERSY